jgi:hypothetical protein
MRSSTTPHMARVHKVHDSCDPDLTPNGSTPKWRNIDKILLFALISVSALFLGALCSRVAGRYDEGLIVYGAARVMNGDIPHRDFWTLYAPGQFYVLAGLFKLFGTSLAVERMWDASVRVGISLATFLVAAHISSRPAALIPWCISVLLMGSVGFYAYPMFPALCLVLFGCYFLLRAFSLGRSRSFAAAGLLFGLAVVFKTEIGMVGVVTSGMVVLGYGLNILNFRLSHGAEQRTPRLIAIMLFGGGIALPLLVVSLYMLSVVMPSVLWENLVEAPRKLVSQYRWIPKPSVIPRVPGEFLGFHLLRPLIRYLTFEWLPFYGPAAILIVAIPVYLQRHLSRSAIPADSIAGALSVFGLAVGLALSDRPDLLHLFPSTLVASLALTHLVFGAWRTSHRRRAAVFAIVCLVVFAGSHIVLPAYRCFVYLKDTWTASPSSIDRAGFVRVEPDEEQAVRFIIERVPSSERIFVGLSRHDRIFVCDSLFYFLAGRHSVTRYHDLVPGVATTVAVQQEIIKSIQRYSIRFVVIFSQLEDHEEPNLSSTSSGVLLLDNFIQDNFGEVAHFGHYRILERQAAPALSMILVW